MGLGLAVACTNRKTVAPVVALRDIRRRSEPNPMSTLFANWVDALAEADREATVPARDLYSGVAWSASRDVASALSRVDADASTWVASAGYGLVAADDDLVPYAATFSPGKADSIARSTAGYMTVNRRWWDHLAAWHPEGVSGPRTFRELADRVDALMVAMSPRYLLAAEQDLLAVARSGVSLVIVSGGLAEKSSLAPWALNFDKRLREPEEVTGHPRLLAASDMSLNQRVAERLISDLGRDAFDFHAASRYLAEHMAKRRPARTWAHREAATDDEILGFLEGRLVEDSSVSKTRLLGEWRACGRQCEQKRFGALYEQARLNVDDLRPVQQEEMAL